MKTLIVPSGTDSNDKADEISYGIIVILTSKTQIFSSVSPDLEIGIDRTRERRITF